MYTTTLPGPQDGPAIAGLLDRAFGTARTHKSSYRLRGSTPAVADLARVARDGQGAIIGTISYTPVLIGLSAAPALLLGPLAVEPRLSGLGIGRSLIGTTVDLARYLGHARVVLVGEPAYYLPLGFEPAHRYAIGVAGERPDRVLAQALTAGAFVGVTGTVRAVCPSQPLPSPFAPPGTALSP